MGKKKDTRVKQLRDLLDDAISVGDDDQIQILRAELESINPNYKDGGLTILTRDEHAFVHNDIVTSPV